MSNDFDKKAKEILNKQFRQKIHAGYDPEDVDQFFDDVIAYIKKIETDYNQINEKLKDNQSIIDDLKKQINNKENIIASLKEELKHYQDEGYSNKILNDRVNTLENTIKTIYLNSLKGNDNKKNK